MSDLTVPSPSVRVSTPTQAAPAKVTVTGTSASPAQPVTNTSPVINTLPVTNTSAKLDGGAQVTSPSVNKGPRPETVRSPQAAPSSASNILTFRDSATGQLVIKLIDEENNAVITQFPSVTQLSNYPKINTNQIQTNTIDEKI